MRRSKLIRVQAASVKKIQETEAQLEKADEDQMRSKEYYQSLLDSIQEQEAKFATMSSDGGRASSFVSTSAVNIAEARITLEAQLGELKNKIEEASA